VTVNVDPTVVEPQVAVDVGPLRSLDSLYRHVAPALAEINEYFRAGTVPHIEWDFRKVRWGEMNFAGLTAFLALAHRLGKFSPHTQTARLIYNPHVFAFWDDINFLSLANEFVRWVPDHIVGGYHGFRHRTNPNSMILAFPESDNVPDPRAHHSQWSRWKDEARDNLAATLINRCGAVLSKHGTRQAFEPQWIGQIGISVAELVVNAHFWGRSAAYVGLQRSTSGVSIAVADAGRGLLATLSEKSRDSDLPKIRNHLEAIFCASFVNSKEYGLRLVIEEVLRRSGWVTISSYDAQIKWTMASWESAKDRVGQDIRKHASLTRLVEAVFPVHDNLATYGYGYRSNRCAVRGVRVAYELRSLPVGVQR